MVAAVKEICIFVIIAQAVMFFAPENSYMKYVRILVGIIMILKITGPVFDLFLDEESEKEINRQIMMLKQEMSREGEALEVEDYGMGIYESIEEELKSRLNQCDSGYSVVGVEISDEQKMIVTLEDKEAQAKKGIQIEAVVIGTGEERKTERAAQKDKLKQLFGNYIGVDASRIEIVFS